MANDVPDAQLSRDWVARDSSIKHGTPPSPKPPSKPRTTSSKFNEMRQSFNVGAALANSGKSKKQPESLQWSPVKTGNSSGGSEQNLNVDWSKGASVKSKTKAELGDGYNRTDMLSCPDCDKMYSSKRDLEIHKSFCYANN